MSAEQLRCGDALMEFDRDLTVRGWNAAAAQLTGVSAEEALGRPCWDVLRGVDDRGNVVCHARCAGARNAVRGNPPRTQALHIRGRDGRVPVLVSTLALPDGCCLHVLTPRTCRGEIALPPRRLEILRLLADGVPAKAIAARLHIAEPTVRSHIRALLRELDAHSQLEAIAHARRRGFVD
jgi:PAS domain S-box-containing protein